MEHGLGATTGIPTVAPVATIAGAVDGQGEAIGVEVGVSATTILFSTISRDGAPFVEAPAAMGSISPIAKSGVRKRTSELQKLHPIERKELQTQKVERV